MHKKRGYGFGQPIQIWTCVFNGHGLLSTVFFFWSVLTCIIFTLEDFQCTTLKNKSSSSICFEWNTLASLYATFASRVLTFTMLQPIRREQRKWKVKRHFWFIIDDYIIEGMALLLVVVVAVVVSVAAVDVTADAVLLSVSCSIHCLHVT